MNRAETSTYSILDGDCRFACRLGNTGVDIRLFRRPRGIARYVRLSTALPFLLRSLGDLGDLGWIDRIEDRRHHRRFLWKSALFRRVGDTGCFRGTGSQMSSGAGSRRPPWPASLPRTGAVADQLSTLSLDPVQQNVVPFNFHLHASF